MSNLELNFIIGFKMHRKSKVISQNQKGFTMVELMIATVIFSIILLVIVASFLQIGRIFYKGVSIDNTNEAARTIIDDINYDIKYSDSYDQGDKTSYFCVGLHRYSYTVDFKQLTAQDVENPQPQFPEGVIQTTIPGGCPSPGSLAGNDPRQLLGAHMQLNDFSFYCTGGGSSCYIHIHVINYGTDNLVFSSAQFPQDTGPDHLKSLHQPDANCSGDLLSTQFCAVADLTTSMALGS